MMHFQKQTRDISWLIHKPIAHRGLHDEKIGLVENCEAAFAAALKHGFSIELDLQLTKDGEAVVFHDDEVDRVLDGKGKVKDFTLRQLKAMKYRLGNDRIQTLAELLEQVNGRETMVIELKTLWDDDFTLTNRAVHLLSNYKGPFALMSFDPDLIVHLAATAEHITRGITADRVDDPYYDPLPAVKRDAMREMAHLPFSRPNFISFDFSQLPFDQITKLKSVGMPIISWTIRNEAQAAIALSQSDQITFENFVPR
jgi:glycerophosphoryl diester phosphodiesterase